MEMLWRLLTAIFYIAAGLGMIAIGWLLSGGMFQNAVCVILAYIAMALIGIGIVKGFFVIGDYRKADSEE